MAWRFVNQPNGLLARFSEVVDDFTDYDMSELEAYESCLGRCCGGAWRAFERGVATMSTETNISKYADILNALDEMRFSPAYATRKRILAQASIAIVDQEEKIAELQATLAAYRKMADVAFKRYNQIHEIHKSAKDNAEVASLVRKCVASWNEVESN